MKLRDIYGYQIAGSPPAMNVQLPSMTAPYVKQRDEKLMRLEQQVNKSMVEAIAKLEPVKPEKFLQPSNKVRMVSYEDAIKELANALKSTDNKA